MAAAIPFIIKAGIGLAFSKVLSGLLTPKARTPLDTSKPAPLSERGSPIPILVGRDLVAPVFAWEGNLITRLEDFEDGGGGKGVGSSGGGQKNRVNFADGIHLLTVGPGKRLRQIRFNGKKVFPAPSSASVVDQELGIEPQTSPSGSEYAVVDDGKIVGSFTIYWGEPDQPLNDQVQAALGVESNLGYIAYVYWNNVRLGGPGVWPSVEYDWEVGPFNAAQTYAASIASPPLGYTDHAPALSGSQAWLENGLAPDESSCLPILSYDPTTSTLTAGGSFSGPPAGGFSVEIRGNSPKADGRWLAQDWSTGPGESYPDGDFELVDNGSKSRPQSQGSGADCWIVNGPDGTFNRNVEDMHGRISEPPGTVTEQFGNQNRGLMMRCYRGLSGDKAIKIRLRRPNQTSINFLPRDYFTTNFYVRVPVVTGAANRSNVKLFVELYSRISTNPPTFVYTEEAYVTFRTSAEGVTVTDTLGDVEYRIELLGSRWYRLQVTTGSLPTSATDSQARWHVPGFEVFETPDATADSVYVAWGKNENGFATFLLSQGQNNYAQTTLFELNPGPASVVRRAGEVCPLEISERGPQGANVAHILYQLLFEEAPHGLGLDQDCYDISSLETIGAQIWDLSGFGEGLRSHIRSNPDDKIEGLVEQLLSEAGIQRYWDVAQGKWGFKLIRREVADATFPEDLIAPDPPEVGRAFGRETLTDLRFVFRDSNINHRENDIYIPLDGESATAVQRQALQTVRDETAAQIVSDRFAQIEQGRPATIKVLGLRDAQLIRTGDVLDFGNLFGPGLLYRTLEVRLDPMRAVTELTLASEQYSVAPLAAENTIPNAGMGQQTQPNLGRTVAPDQEFDLWEASAFLGRSMQFVPLRVPSEDDTAGAGIMASFDDVSYLAETATGKTPCGLLISDFAADQTEQLDPGTNSFTAAFYLENGPLFRAQADSVVGSVRTLSDADWGAGRQWLLVNNEVMYVKEFEPLGDHLWRAKHVLRARLDSQRSTHLAGTACYILNGDSLGLFDVPYAGRGQDLYVKSIPTTGSLSAPPANVTAVTVTPTGKGISPIRLSHLREKNFIDKWRVRDTTYRWDYSLPEALDSRTGLGMQGAGELTSTSADVWPGKFTVALSDSGGNIIYGPVVTTDNEIFVPSSAYSSAAAGDITLQVLAVDEFGTDGVRQLKTFPQA